MKTRLILALVLATVCIAAPSQGNYTQQYALSQDATFANQVSVAMLQAAANVMTETATTAGHLQRANFAIQVIQSPAKWQSVIALLIASQSNNPMTPLTVPSTVADSLIQTAVNAQWSNMAGYFSQ